MVEVHKHCVICGTPIPFDKKVCSPKCQDVLTQRQAKIRKTKLISYAMFVIFILVFIGVFIIK